MPIGEKTKLLWQNPEYRKRMIKAHKGQKAWNKGRKCPEFSGKNHPRYKGGWRKADGRWITLMPAHPFTDSKGYIRRSRLVAERYLGRYLFPKEVVHHINRDKSDDHPENLYLFPSESAHLSYEKNRLKDRNKILPLKSNLITSSNE